MNNKINQVLEKEGGIVWKSVFGLLILPLFALITVPWYAFAYGFQASDYICLAVFYFLTGISITAGYHRLWAHKTYKANKVVRHLLLMFGTAALQNSVLQWASDHRKHHKDVDDPIKDPYAATKGFWYSHFGWLLKYNVQHVQEIKGIDDLAKDKSLVFQHDYYLILSILTCLGLPILYGLFTGRVVACLLMGGFVRVILVHHATFCINSLAHILGRQPYSTKNTARDSFVAAIITGGEGYHNYHHAFAGDYRNGIRFFDFDPSKWLIAGLAQIGWCYNLKRTPKHLVEIAKAKVKLEEALKRKNKTCHFSLEEKYIKLVANIKNMYSAKREYLRAKKDNVLSKGDVQMIKYKYKNLKLEFIEAKRKYKIITLV